MLKSRNMFFWVVALALSPHLTFCADIQLLQDDTFLGCKEGKHYAFKISNGGHDSEVVKIIDGKLLLDVKSVLPGIKITNYENGRIESIFAHENGLRDGPSYGFYESGQLRSYGNFVKGRQDGKGIRWGKCGNILQEWYIAEGIEIYRHTFYVYGGLLEIFEVFDGYKRIKRFSEKGKIIEDIFLKE